MPAWSWTTVLALVCALLCAESAGAAPTRCGGTRPLTVPVPAVAAPQVQAFIAHPPGVTPSVADLVALQTAFANVRQRLLLATGGAKTIRVHAGDSGCDESEIDIVDITLAPGSRTFINAREDVAARVGETPLVLWLGIAVGFTDAGGIASSPGTAQERPATPAQDGALNGGVAIGAANGSVLLHELLHMLGAVNADAPHVGSGLLAGHVTSPLDVMYASVGSGTEVIDLGGDDYFNPAGDVIGRAGARLWNVFDSLYLCPVDRCSDSPPRPVLSVVTRPETNGEVEVRAGGATHYQWLSGSWPLRDAVGDHVSLVPFDDLAVRGFSADGAASEVVAIDDPPFGAESSPDNVRLTLRQLSAPTPRVQRGRTLTVRYELATSATPSRRLKLCVQGAQSVLGARRRCTWIDGLTGRSRGTFRLSIARDAPLGTRGATVTVFGTGTTTAKLSVRFRVTRN